MAWKQYPVAYVSPAAEANARQLRRKPTDAEKTLWKHLRGDFAGLGTHFRRQVPIGPFISDFCCFSQRLIIELDGPVHDDPLSRKRDHERDLYLRTQGYLVLRFRNDDVVQRTDVVLANITTALGSGTPTPGPSPQGGGEQAVQA